MMIATPVSTTEPPRATSGVSRSPSSTTLPITETTGSSRRNGITCETGCLPIMWYQMA